jgi:hypothetical protein
MGPEETMDGWTRALALGQGAYYLGTGLWPIVHLPSFEAVTGPKPEGWLVKTVGALISVVGATALLAGVRRRASPELRLLAGGSALAMGVVDVVYPAKGRISPVYLLDALPELALALGWAASGLRSRARPALPGRGSAGRRGATGCS